ncbi:Transcription factor TFIIB protein [Raphanus sativus]|nr:Transcription factor TFIIB protein [Raphanus sativus]
MRDVARVRQLAGRRKRTPRARVATRCWGVCVEYLGLELQEIDLVGMFVKTASGSPRLSGVDGRRPMPLMVSCEDWWKGKSKMSQRLTLKEVLEKDIGLDDDLPISYVKGCDAILVIMEVSCLWSLEIARGRKGREDVRLIGRIWDKVHFVMLNVDNTKWEQELNEFGVEAEKQSIPHARAVGRQYSSTEAPKVHQVTHPFSHG